jgi:hypothetical protein
LVNHHRPNEGLSIHDRSPDITGRATAPTRTGRSTVPTTPSGENNGNRSRHVCVLISHCIGALAVAELPQQFWLIWLAHPEQEQTSAEIKKPQATFARVHFRRIAHLPVLSDTCNGQRDTVAPFTWPHENVEQQAL